MEDNKGAAKEVKTMIREHFHDVASVVARDHLVSWDERKDDSPVRGL